MKLRMITCAALVVVALTTMVPVFAANGTVTGTVTADTLGSPAISGALVRTDGDPSYSAITGSDGTYNLTAPTGAYDLLAAASGFNPQRTKITVSSGSTAQSFALRAATTVTPPINLPSASDSGEPHAAPVAPGEGFPVNFADAASVPVVGAPVIAAQHETVKPNETFTLTGSRFTSRSGADAGTDTIVWVWARTSDTTGVLRQARVWSVDQYTIMATMPDDVPFGLYFVWVENSVGVSAPVCVNRTRSNWVGPIDNKAYAGCVKRVFGKNISQNHGNTTSFVYIRPAAGGAYVLCTTAIVDPYSVEFTVPLGTPNGSYKVYVHNGHGGLYGWSDPVDMVVEDRWVRGTSVYPLSPNGVDDTSALQNAVNTVSGWSNGGTVQLGAGSYRIKNTMTIPQNVEIKGAGMDQTYLLLQLSLSPHTAISVSGDHVAFTDLTYRTCYGYPVPVYVAIGVFGNYAKFTNFCFTEDAGAHTNFALDSQRLIEYDHCTMYTDFIGSWIHDSLLYGDHYNYTEAAVQISNYQVFEDNHIETKAWPHNGSNYNYYNSDYSINTSVVPGGWDQLAATVWAKRVALAYCSYSYIANNTSKDVAVQDNKGEMILMHGGGGAWFGNIISNSGLTASLRCDGKVDGQVVTIQNYGNPLIGGGVLLGTTQWWDGGFLVITEGAGKGQRRKVVAQTATTVTVDSPWRVQPDSTSKAIITGLYRENMVYNNRLLAFPPGYVHSTSASVGVSIDGNGWGNMIEGNTSYRTDSGRTIVANSAGPSFWNEMRDEKSYETTFGGYRAFQWDTNSVMTIALGNAYRGGDLRVVGSTDGSVEICGEGSIAEGINTTAKRGYALNGAAQGDWSGPQYNRGWTLYRNGVVTTIDGPTNPPAMQPVYLSAVDDRQMLSGNTYSGGASQNYWLATGLSAYRIPVALNRLARFSGWVGGTVDQAIVPIANAGIQSMTWTVTPSDTWITASIAANGSLAAESDMGRLVVNVNTTNMTAGRRWGYVDVVAGVKTVRVGVCVDLAAGPPSNQPPTASFGVSVSAFAAPRAVAFDATASVDLDGSILNYYWSFGDGTYGTGVTATHTYATQGNYIPVLTVADNLGVQDTAYSIITVAPALTSVTLTGAPGAPVNAGTAITLTASSAGGYQPQYKFLVRQGTGGWTIQRDYSTVSTWVWTPSSPAYYEIKVYARTSGSNNVYDVTSNVLGYPVGLLPVTGMALWLKADAGVTKDGSNAVSEWADQISGSTRKVSQGNQIYKPVYYDGVLNGKPVIHFNGGANALSTTQSVVTGSGGFTAFIVGRTTRIQGPSDQYFWWLGSNTSTGGYGQWIVYDGTTPFLGTSWGGPTNYLILPSPPTGNTWYRMCSRYASGSHGYWVDGTAVVGNTVTGSNLASGFTVGNKSASAGNGLYGDVAEILIYSRNLSESERTGVDQYLQARWSAPVAVTKDKIRDVKALDDGVLVSITSPKVAVTASGVYSDGCIYVEESDRVYGMKVLNAGSVVLWDNLTLTGITDTDPSTGERMLRVTRVDLQTSGTPLGSLGMLNKAVATNGQLVTVWGKVTNVAATYITLDDGSGSPAMVEVDGLVVPIGSLPVVGQYVSATGPAGFMVGGVAAVRVRSASDIQVY